MILVEGEPSHGAYPHHGRDPILALAQVVVALHAQASRRIDPLSPASLTVGVLEGGSAENVIPARACARGALRAHRPQERLALREMVAEVAGGVAAAHGCRASVELVPGEPALENDPVIVARARELLANAGLTSAPEWRVRCTIPSCCPPTPPSAPSRARRPSCTWPQRRRRGPPPAAERARRDRAGRVDLAAYTIDRCPTTCTSLTPTRPTR